ncbi:MAG: translation elongation factor Ts [Phycisphaerales bacterium]|nr:translation elongation factor Ts [Phycisphaerales bacterium]
MAAISAKEVQELRTKTGLAMMDCKNALVEANGDQTSAMEILRKKFADKMATRADKEAANGRIGVYADDKGAAMCELRCETDFVATNSDFRNIADSLAEHCVKSGVTDVEQFKASKMASGQTVNDLMTDAFGRLKENMQIKRLARMEGPSACYVHHNGQVGTAIACTAPAGDAGKGICMHIASNQTLAGRVREDVDAAEVKEAKEKATAEVAGKPEQIIDKIVGGKMDKWFAERVLVEQPFVMDDKKSVGEFARENGFEIKSYLKFEVGALA